MKGKLSSSKEDDDAKTPSQSSSQVQDDEAEIDDDDNERPGIFKALWEKHLKAHGTSSVDKAMKKVSSRGSIASNDSSGNLQKKDKKDDEKVVG